MTGYVVIIPADGEPYKKQVNEPFGYKTLQECVGGYIEHVGQTSYGFFDTDIWCNEEGRLHGLPHNPTATAYALIDVVGDVVVTVNNGPETLLLNETQAAHVIVNLP